MSETDKYFKYSDKVDNYGFDWGRLAVTLGPKVNGAKNFSSAVVHVPPGKGHDRHNHPGSEEIIFIMKGRGEQMIEDESGKPHTQIVERGCTVFVPESRFHSTHNTGDEEMEIFVVYSPPGPEEELRELPDFHVIPATEL